jgi:hypothetical protein
MRLPGSGAAVRQSVSPTVCILAFHFAVRPAYPAITSPASRAIILTLFLELSAPTAMAASLLCNMHDYMPADFASAFFFKTVCSRRCFVLDLTDCASSQRNNMVPRASSR